MAIIRTTSWATEATSRVERGLWNDFDIDGRELKHDYGISHEKFISNSAGIYVVISDHTTGERVGQWSVLLSDWHRYLARTEEGFNWWRQLLGDMGLAICQHDRRQTN